MYTGSRGGWLGIVFVFVTLMDSLELRGRLSRFDAISVSRLDYVIESVEVFGKSKVQQIHNANFAKMSRVR